MRLNAVLLPAPFGPMIDVMRLRSALEAQIVDRPQAAEGLVEIGDLDHDPAFRRVSRRCTRPHSPSGRNITKMMKIMPSTNKWRSV